MELAQFFRLHVSPSAPSSLVSDLIWSGCLVWPSVCTVLIFFFFPILLVLWGRRWLRASSLWWSSSECRRQCWSGRGTRRWRKSRRQKSSSSSSSSSSWTWSLLRASRKSARLRPDKPYEVEFVKRSSNGYARFVAGPPTLNVVIMTSNAY